MALGRAHTSAKAADPTELLSVEQMVEHAQCHRVWFSPTHKCRLSAPTGPT